MKNFLGDADDALARLDTKVVPWVDDPMMMLKQELLSFFQERIKSVSSHEVLKTKVERALLEKLETDELGFDELMIMYNATSKNSFMSSDSLISLFKSSPGSPSPLIATVGKDDTEDDQIRKKYEGMSPEDAAKIDIISRALSKAQDNPTKKDSGE